MACTEPINVELNESLLQPNLKTKTIFLRQTSEVKQSCAEFQHVRASVELVAFHEDKFIEEFITDETY